MASLIRLVSLLLLGTHLSAAAQTSKDLKCLVCRTVIEEIELAIQKVDPKKKVEVGSYRLDSEGNQNQRLILFSRSEVHLNEVLEDVCERMSDYVQATYKASGEPLLLRIVLPDGKMNPDMSKVDITPDADLNKGLKFYCEGIVEEYDEDIVRVFSSGEDNADIRVCSDIAGLCSQYVTEDYGTQDHEEL